MKSKFFGAKATVFLKFDGNLEEIAKVLSDNLFLPEFWYKNDMDPPHNLCAMTETLGFEVWLQASNDVENYNYIFEIETGMEIEDRMENEMFDLSPWFAKEISRSCEIETFIQN